MASSTKAKAVNPVPDKNKKPAKKTKAKAKAGGGTKKSPAPNLTTILSRLQGLMGPKPRGAP